MRLQVRGQEKGPHCEEDGHEGKHEEVKVGVREDGGGADSGLALEARHLLVGEVPHLVDVLELFLGEGGVPDFFGVAYDAVLSNVVVDDSGKGGEQGPDVEEAVLVGDDPGRDQRGHEGNKAPRDLPLPRLVVG